MKKLVLLVFLMILQVMHADAKTSPIPVVYIVAHPDDETLFGGTLGKLKEGGHSIYGIYITRGEGGKINKVTGNASDNYSMRPLELKKAAKSYGVKEILLLNQPDQPMRDPVTGKPSTEGELFMNAKVWNLPWIKERIKSYLEVIRPKVILTLDPKSSGVTHSHHQAAAKIALESIQESSLLAHVSGVYGIYEINHYPKQKFSFTKNTFEFDTSRFSEVLGMTYRKFQSVGASAHATQSTGYLGELPIALEKWEPLIKEKNDLVFRKIINSSYTNVERRSEGDVTFIEERASP